MVLWREAAKIAARQHGVIARRQLLSLGIPSASIALHAEREGWRAVHRGVYALGGTAATFHQAAAAAVLAAGEVAVASHLTAGYLHGIVPLQPQVIEVLLPASCQSRKLEGVRVTRSRTLRRGDRCLVSGIATTTLPRTVIDLATILEPPEIRSIVIDARQSRRLSLRRVAKRLLDVGPLRNSGELRRIVWELDHRMVDSVLEEYVRDLLRAAGLPLPEPGPYAVRLGDRTVAVDIAWPEVKVAIEVDGYGYHSSRSAMDRDHRKQNALVLQGWKVLRISWDRVHRDPDGFVAEIAALLATT